MVKTIDKDTIFEYTEEACLFKQTAMLGVGVLSVSNTR
jgi:hypothetical protein